MRVFALLLLLLASVSSALAIKDVATHSIKAAAAAQPADSDLNTYAFTAHDVQLSSGVADASISARKGTTRVTMQLTAEQLQPAVPVITAAKTGLVHDVLDAWTFFKVRNHT
jgi:hypothetical protein